MILVKTNHYFILATLLVTVLSGCASTQSEVKGRVWKTNANSLSFPELESDLMPSILQGAYKKNGTKSSKTNGLVFSGGGTRSATLTLGQLRSLRELGVLDQFHYISAISGGSWAAVPYVYARCGIEEKCEGEGYTGSARFLGIYTPPNKLKSDDLKGNEKMGSLGKAIANSGVSNEVLSGWVSFKGDETFSYAIGSKFLKPFSLNGNKFFTLNKEVRDRIVADNISLKDEFYIPEKNKPFLIVGSTVQLNHYALSTRKPNEIFPLVMTPLYVGVPTDKVALGKNSSQIGGGYIEPFMYNSKPPRAENIKICNECLTKVTIKNGINRFSLSDVIGTSGAAPQAVLTGGLKYLFLLPSNLGFPELYHWPITEHDNYKPNMNDDFVHGDGGNIDNIGLMPLLARRVDNIMVFINTQEDFDTGYANGDIPPYAMYSDLQDYFKYNEKRPKNIVFSESQLKPLYEALEEDKEAGRPLVHCSIYSIKENKFFGVLNTQGYTPRICWFYNDKPTQWTNLIKQAAPLDDELEKIIQEKRPYKNIPHSKTFMQQWHDFQFIDRNNQHVNIESNISGWAVCESAKEVFNQKTGIKINKVDGTSCN